MYPYFLFVSLFWIMRGWWIKRDFNGDSSCWAQVVPRKRQVCVLSLTMFDHPSQHVRMPSFCACFIHAWIVLLFIYHQTFANEQQTIYWLWFWYFNIFIIIYLLFMSQYLAILKKLSFLILNKLKKNNELLIIISGPIIFTQNPQFRFNILSS